MLSRVGISAFARMAVTRSAPSLSAVARTQVCCLSAAADASKASIQGTVKAFDTRRGYGFITPADGSDDVFVHQTQIRRTGFRFLKVGEEVEFALEVSDKGRKALNVTGPNGEVLPSRQFSDGPQQPRRFVGGARRTYGEQGQGQE